MASSSVGQERRFRCIPSKFEAGTPAIEATIGFGAAVKWMRNLGMDAIREHDLAMRR